MNIYPFFALIHCHLVNFIFSLAPLWPLGKNVVLEVKSRKESQTGKLEMKPGDAHYIQYPKWLIK